MIFSEDNDSLVFGACCVIRMCVNRDLNFIYIQFLKFYPGAMSKKPVITSLFLNPNLLKRTLEFC